MACQQVPAHGSQLSPRGVVAASGGQALEITPQLSLAARTVRTDRLVQAALDALDRIVAASCTRQLLFSQPAHNRGIDGSVTS